GGRAFGEATTAASRPTICAFIKFLQSLSYGEMAERVAEIGFDGIESTVRAKGHVLPERVEEDLPRQHEAAKRAGIDITIMTTDVVRVDDPYTEDVLRTGAALGLKTDARRGDATAQALLAMGHQHAALATPSTNRPAPRPGALNAAAFGLPADTQPAWSQLQKALRHHRIKPDLEAGRALARAAADAGSPTGMTVYSDYLDQGLGGPQDRNAAMQWREKAIAAGSILAVFRNEARQLEQNPDHPLDTLEQLADTGHATAAAALADHWRARITYGSVVPGSRKDPFTKSIERLVQAASAGHPESIVRVLRRVKANAKTPGLDRDQLPALARHATELGHPQAADLMAQILAQHEAPRRDRLNWYRLAVAGGYEPAYAKAADVALATEESPAQLIDGPTAAWLYAKSAQSGDTGSLINLADMLGIGKALPRDTPTALALLREAARRGSLDAANALGRLAGGFRENWDVPPDPDQYRHWLGIEADLGNADAAVVLGSNYEDGDLWPADAAQALYHYAMAADLGQPLGAEAVAYAYFRELHGLPKDPAEIITWAARAGEAGNLDAISLFCGSFLNEAVIVTLSIQVGKLDEMEDPLIAPDQLSRALHWVRWAADQEHAESAYILAETYRHGIPKPDLKNFSIKPDTRKAIRWYEQAVEYGHEDAPAIMYDIAKLYHEQGRIPQSGQWMKRALEAGSEEAIEEQLLKEQAAAGDVDAMRKLGRHEQADAVEARRAEAAKPLTTKQQREAARLAWRAYFQKRGKAAFDAGELNHQQWHRYVVEALQHGDAIYDQPGNPYDLEDTETLETEHQRFLKRAKQTP
ncbi:MAG: hypothetical protein AAGI68_12365, partial [Planctomycetota bacterium]